MQIHPEPPCDALPPTTPQDDGFFSLRITLQTIELLDAVTRHGSVTSAATALSMPPSTLSAALQALEASLGLTLFYPGNGPTQPTPACRALLDEGRFLLPAHATAGNSPGRPPSP